MNKREFLKRGVMGAVGVVVGGGVLSALTGAAKAPGATPQKTIGLELYSLRDAMGKDPEGTLRAVAAMGYKELETASYINGKLYGYAPKDFRALVEGLGMKVASAHIAPARNLSEEEQLKWWDKALDDQKAAGCRYVVLPSMALPTNAAELKAAVEYLNKVGALAVKKGLKFGFHNHAQEFKTVDGTVVYDYLVENTDPKKVFFQMDVYWLNMGGKSPMEYLARYAGRFPNLHIKDESIIGDSGQLDFAAIFEAAYKQGTRDYFVEVERYSDAPEKCVKISYNFLMNASYVK
ncbi:MAG: sugar phosphate isomerase/epimerase [Rikenellaceae bacterium]|nr:sugar phosphate isomerase/epimerase [Rikenellaceae bacterium]